MPQSGVVVVGDANVDLILRLPERGSLAAEITHLAPELHGGGSAANTAVALARLGVPAALIGTVGDDGYGRWVVDDLVREGVDTAGVRTVREAWTSMVLALIEPTGERRVAVWPHEGGAHTKLEPDMIDPSLITGADWLHTTGMVLRASPVREAVIHAMELARDAGVPVSLDLNLRRECWGLQDATQRTFERAIELADVVLGSAEEELMPITGESMPEAAARALCTDRRTVIARLGAEGALVAMAKEVVHVPAFPVEVVDTLGAGDAFDGGYIAACLADMDAGEAARWGNAAAAWKIGRTGARGLARREELEGMVG